MANRSALVAAFFAFSLVTAIAGSITVEVMDAEVTPPSVEQRPALLPDSGAQNEAILREMMEAVADDQLEAETLASFTDQSSVLTEPVLVK